MKRDRVGVVINYSSLDNIFINTIVAECLKFSNNVVISYSERLYDNQPDDLQVLEHLKNTGVMFSEYAFHKDIADVFGTRIFHNFARITAYNKIKDNVDAVLFIDGDEVPEGGEMGRLIGAIESGDFCLKLANYWYYKTPSLRATVCEDSAVFVSKSIIDQVHAAEFTQNIFYERELYTARGAERNVLGLNRKPIIHHYSWAKPSEVLRRKVRTWGHKGDATNWASIVEQIIKTPEGETYKSLVNGYELEFVWSAKFNFIFKSRKRHVKTEDRKSAV